MAPKMDFHYHASMECIYPMILILWELQLHNISCIQTSIKISKTPTAYSIHSLNKKVKSVNGQYPCTGKIYNYTISSTQTWMNRIMVNSKLLEYFKTKTFLKLFEIKFELQETNIIHCQGHYAIDITRNSTHI